MGAEQTKHIYVDPITRLRNIPDDMKTPELCLAAVKQDGMALEYVPDHLKTPELCLTAVRKHGLAYLVVPDRLKTVEMSICLINWLGASGLVYVPDHLQTDEVIALALSYNSRASYLIKKNQSITNELDPRKMPEKAYDTLHLGYDEETAIQDGELMVDFHDEFKHGRFYRKKTFDELIRPRMKNGYTGQPIKEYTVYKAIV